MFWSFVELVLNFFEVGNVVVTKSIYLFEMYTICTLLSCLYFLELYRISYEFFEIET